MGETPVDPKIMATSSINLRLSRDICGYVDTVDTVDTAAIAKPQ